MEQKKPRLRGFFFGWSALEYPFFEAVLNSPADFNRRELTA